MSDTAVFPGGVVKPPDLAQVFPSEECKGRVHYVLNVVLFGFFPSSHLLPSAGIGQRACPPLWADFLKAIDVSTSHKRL
jgi:hypothetical protein